MQVSDHGEGRGRDGEGGFKKSAAARVKGPRHSKRDLKLRKSAEDFSLPRKNKKIQPAEERGSAAVGRTSQFGLSVYDFIRVGRSSSFPSSASSQSWVAVSYESCGLFHSITACAEGANYLSRYAMGRQSTVNRSTYYNVAVLRNN